MKKVFSMLMIALMVFSLFPMVAAQDFPEDDFGDEEYFDDFERGGAGFDDQFDDFPDRRDFPDGPPDDFRDFEDGRSFDDRGPGGFDDRGRGDFDRGPPRGKFRGGNHGPNIPDFGNRPERIFGMAMRHIEEEMDEAELAPLCQKGEEGYGEIGDLLVSKIKAKIGEVSNACDEFPIDQCEEMVKEGCGRIGGPPPWEPQDELEKLEFQAHVCPVPDEAVFNKLCKLRSEQWENQRREIVSDKEVCEREIARHGGDRRDDRRNDRIDTGNVERFPGDIGGARNNNKYQDDPRNYEKDDYRDYPDPDRKEGDYRDYPDPDRKEGDYRDYPDPDRQEGDYRDYPDPDRYEDKENYDSGRDDGHDSGGSDSRSYDSGGDSGGSDSGSYDGGGDSGRSDSGSHDSGGDSGGSDSGSHDSGGDSGGSDSGSYDGGGDYGGDPNPGPREVFRYLTGAQSADGGEPVESDPGSSEERNSDSSDSVGDDGHEDFDPEFDNDFDGSYDDEEHNNDYDDGRSDFREEEDYSRQKDRFENDDRNRGPSKEEMIKDCMSRMGDRGGFDHCEIEAKISIKQQTKMCTRFDKDKDQCLNRGSSQCGKMKEAQAQCKAELNEANLKEFIVKEARRRCPQMDEDYEGEDDEFVLLIALADDATVANIEDLEDTLGVELDRYRSIQDSIVYGAAMESDTQAENLADIAYNFPGGFVLGTSVEDNIGERESDKNKKLHERIKLASSRISDAKGDFESITDAHELAALALELEKESDKSVVYKLLRALGTQKARELAEVQELRGDREELRKTIEGLREDIDFETNPITNTILNEELDVLEEHSEELEGYIEDKEDSAGGIFGTVGGAIFG